MITFILVAASIPVYAVESDDFVDFGASENGIEEDNVCLHESDTGSVTRESTCSLKGEITYRCIKCGKVLRTQLIPKLDHIPSENGEVAKQPTCYDVGQINYYCTVCGEIAFAKSIPSLPWDSNEANTQTQETSPSPSQPQTPNKTLEKPSVVQAPTNTNNNEVADLPSNLINREDEPVNDQYRSPKPTQQISTVKEIQGHHMGITVPIFFTDAEFNESGNYFIGNLRFQTDQSAPVEIRNVELVPEKRWKLVPYKGEDAIRKRQISVAINHCLSTAGGFEFNPKYFTVPIPYNGILELPFKVCVYGPDWTASKHSPLKIKVNIGAAT